jgi:hypothetical protein
MSDPGPGCPAMTAHLPHLPRLLAAAALALRCPRWPPTVPTSPSSTACRQRPGSRWTWRRPRARPVACATRLRQRAAAAPERSRCAYAWPPAPTPTTWATRVFAQALWRSAAAPLWLQATDANPGATVLGHGLNLLGVSYVAIDGVTIGPAQVGAWNGQRHADPQPLQAAAGVHVAGVAQDAQRSALRDGQAGPGHLRPLQRVAPPAGAAR